MSVEGGGGDGSILGADGGNRGQTTSAADSPPSLIFLVPGIAVPQGSKKAFAVGKRAVIVDDNKASLKLWRSTFIDTAQRLIDRDRWQMLVDGAVSVSLLFYLPKPKSRPKKDRYPDRKPDVDKLARAALDALTIAGVFRDDAQVCRLELSKAFTDERTPPFTRVVVRALT